MICGFRAPVSTFAMAGLLLMNRLPAAASPERMPLPETAESWRLEASPQVYDGDDLYLFINGGAELYHEFGFRRAWSAVYTDTAGHEINAEVYAMADSDAAFGMYTVRKGKTGHPLGNGFEGFLESYYLNFWKGRYLVTLIALDTDSLTTRGLVLLARTISQRLSGSADRPPLYQAVSQALGPDCRCTLAAGPLALGVRLAGTPPLPPGFTTAVIAESDSAVAVLARYADSVLSPDSLTRTEPSADGWHTAVLGPFAAAVRCNDARRARALVRALLAIGE